MRVSFDGLCFNESFNLMSQNFDFFAAKNMISIWISIHNSFSS